MPPVQAAARPAFRERPSIARYARDKTETKQLKLSNPVPVELRYETIVVEDGKLHIYRDVYDQDANTEENLRDVLEAAGARFEDLSQEERAQVLDALLQMSGKSTPKTQPVAIANQNPSSSPANSNDKKSSTAKKTRGAARNQKEIVIEIAALNGKGYPAPAGLDSGAGKTKKV